MKLLTMSLFDKVSEALSKDPNTLSRLVAKVEWPFPVTYEVKKGYRDDVDFRFNEQDFIRGLRILGIVFTFDKAGWHRYGIYIQENFPSIIHVRRVEGIDRYYKEVNNIETFLDMFIRLLRNELLGNIEMDKILLEYRAKL